MSNKINYSSKGNSVDGTNFCSGVETLAENLMEDNEQDAVITFPSKDGWASLRSTSYRMTTENAEAILPLPIYKVRKILVKFDNIYISWGSGGSSSWRNYLNEFFNNYDKTLYGVEVDITKYVLSDIEWLSLSLASGDADYAPYIGGLYKDNTFYWQKGSCKIPFLSTIYVIGQNGIPLITSGIDNSPTYARLARSVLCDIGKDYKNNKNQTLSAAVGNTYIGSIETDVRDWLFRIEYVPITSSTKMRARKSAKTKIDFFQPFNQRAELNAVGAFGKNMWLTAQKTGVREITVVKNYTALADIPPLGALVRHNGKKYRLVANKYVQTNTVYMQVIHTLSENWSSKSKHIAVDQKFRNWNIPQDILWRNLYWEDFLVVSKKYPRTGEKGSISIKYLEQVFHTDITNDKAIDSFFLKTVGMETGVTSPCSTYPLGNSLVFSASMKDNLSAGLYQKEENLCAEAFYCNEDGTADKMTIILSDGVCCGFYESGEAFNGPLSIQEDVLSGGQQMYPCALVPFLENGDGLVYFWNAPKYPLFNETFLVNKDPGEAIKFTYQIHFIEDDPDIILGTILTSKHPLISRASENRSFYIFASMKYLRVGDEDVDFKYCEYRLQSADDSDEKWFTIESFLEENFDLDRYPEKDFEYFKLKWTNDFIAVIKNHLSFVPFKSWGIADSNKKLIVGCNDMTYEYLYFTLTHKR